MRMCAGLDRRIRKCPNDFIGAQGKIQFDVYNVKVQELFWGLRRSILGPRGLDARFRPLLESRIPR